MLTSTLLPLALLQTPALKTWEFGEPDSSFGAALCAVGDWDGDGVEDYAVGAPDADVQAGFFTYTRHGRVEVRSGATGLVIAATANLYPSDDIGLGTRLAAGFDSDQDGLPEIVATAGTLQEVTVLERLGPTSSVLVRIADIEPVSSSTLSEQDFGGTLANVGDLTGDGVPDLAIGSPYSDKLLSGIVTATDAGAVRLVSGADWSTAATYTYGGAFARFGSAIATVDDMNGTGSARELAVGAPGRTNSTNNTAGRVHFVDPLLPGAVANFETLVASTVGTGFGVGLLDLGSVSGGPGSGLVVGSADVRLTLGPETFVELLLIYEDVVSGSVELFDLDTLTRVWIRGGSTPPIYDGRSLSAGNLDGDAPDELVTVVVSSGTEAARIEALHPPTGLTEHTFRAGSALARFPGAPTLVGPDVSGDGRGDLILGSRGLEFDAGATFGYIVADGPPGPSQPQTWTVGAGQDFEGLSQAAMVASPGDTLLAQPGEYALAVLDTHLTVVGASSQATVVQAIEVKGTDGGRLEGLGSGFTTLGGISGRMTLESVRGLVLAVAGCPDVTVHRSSFLPGTPAVRVDDARVELVDCDLEGKGGLIGAAEGWPALHLGGGADVLVADSRLLGSGPGTPGPFGAAVPAPAVILEIGSQLDLRGGPSALVQGGTDPNDPADDAADVRSEAQLAFQVGLVVSSSYPTLDVEGLALTSYDAILRPWLDYASSAKLGDGWAVEAFAEGGDPGVLYVSLAPLDVHVPQLLDVPVQIDPTQAVDITSFVGGGPGAPFSVLYPTPLNPLFDGVEVHVQAIVLRPSGLLDGTNGGALQLRL